MIPRDAILAAGLPVVCATPARAGIADDVAACWNIGSLSAEAIRTTVTVEVQMARTGRPRIDTIRMLDFEGGSRGGATQAFEAARRAVIRCGIDGFALPARDRGQWQRIQMTFDPSQMRIR